MMKITPNSKCFYLNPTFAVSVIQNAKTVAITDFMFLEEQELGNTIKAYQPLQIVHL